MGVICIKLCFPEVVLYRPGYVQCFYIQVLLSLWIIYGNHCPEEMNKEMGRLQEGRISDGKTKMSPLPKRCHTNHADRTKYEAEAFHQY